VKINYKRAAKPQIHVLCHESEPNPSKNRAMHEGDDNMTILYNVNNDIHVFIIYLAVIMQNFHDMILVTSQLPISERRAKYQHACKKCISVTSQ
jgi:hypothetical protein